MSIAAVSAVAAVSLLAGSAAYASSVHASWHEVSSVAGSSAGATMPTTTPDGSQILVPNYNTGVVDVFSAATGHLINTITVGGFPYAIAVSPDGATAYVSTAKNPVTNMFGVAVIPIASDATATVPAGYIDITAYVGSALFGVGVSPDGSTLYVTDDTGSQLVAISTANPASIRRFPVPRPRGLAISPDGQTIYVAEGVADRVAAISASGAILSTVAVGPVPTSLALSPTDPTQLLVVSNLRPTVTPITSSGGGTSMVAGTDITLASYGQGVAYAPDGTAAFVTQDDLTMSVIDTSARTVTSTVPVGASLNGAWGVPYGVAPSPDGTKVYVTLNADISRLVTLSGTAPTVAAASLPDGTPGTAYSHVVTATGDPVITLSLSSGALPPGLTFDPATGAIAGTPTDTGTFTFTITGTNTFGTTSRTFTLAVRVASTPAASPSPTVSTVGASVNTGGTLRESAAAHDGRALGYVALAAFISAALVGILRIERAVRSRLRRSS